MLVSVNTEASSTDINTRTYKVKPVTRGHLSGCLNGMF